MEVEPRTTGAAVRVIRASGRVVVRGDDGIDFSVSQPRVRAPLYRLSIKCVIDVFEMDYYLFYLFD